MNIASIQSISDEYDNGDTSILRNRIVTYTDGNGVTGRMVKLNLIGEGATATEELIAASGKVPADIIAAVAATGWTTISAPNTTVLGTQVREYITGSRRGALHGPVGNTGVYPPAQPVQEG